ncbi:hypothetical protein EEB15_16480 [Ramlibacter sp. WS9]|nr:hypothetical protein EEB15_16480 [Ramlibacter sp. WS9]
MKAEASVKYHPGMYDPETFRVEQYTTGTVFVADTDASRANKRVFERHLVAEWASDIEGTMATVHPEGAYQTIPAMGVDVRGKAGIREFYLGRFASWPGPALPSFNRVTVTDICIYVEGTFDIHSTGDDFKGLNLGGKSVSVPCMIVLECRDALLVGEIVYMDSGAIKVS